MYPRAMESSCAGELRRDAARNRAALITAACEVFGERGLDAPLDEIATRAGVGNATLYRRFACREALIAAVFEERMADHAAAVDEALENPDPWAGFRSYVLDILAMQAADRGLADLLSCSGDDATGELARLREHAYDGAIELVRRAQEAGELRKDFGSQDIVLILMANSGVVQRTAKSAPESWRRLAAFILDGLRAESAKTTP
jgi:AcrR family transcriptional regulator